MDIPLILSRIRPRAAWGWRGGRTDDLSQLVWTDPVQPVPTRAEVDAEWLVILEEGELARVSAQAVATFAASLAGRAVSSLSTAELRGLLELTMIMEGRVDLPTRTIRHPDAWPGVRDVLGGVSFFAPSPPVGFWSRVWDRLRRVVT